MDEIVQNPKKMRQRFIDNQINNAKKKKDSKELKRLRAMWAEVKERERGQPPTPVNDEEEENGSGDDEAPTRKRKRENKGKGKAPIVNTPREPATKHHEQLSPLREYLVQDGQHANEQAADQQFDALQYWNSFASNLRPASQNTVASSSHTTPGSYVISSRLATSARPPIFPNAPTPSNAATFLDAASPSNSTKVSNAASLPAAAFLNTATGATAMGYGININRASDNRVTDYGALLQGGNDSQPDGLSYEEPPYDWNDYVNYEADS